MSILSFLLCWPIQEQPKAESKAEDPKAATEEGKPEDMDAEPSGEPAPNDAPANEAMEQ